MKNNTKTIALYAIEFALIFAARVLDHAVTGWLPLNAAIITLTAVFTCVFLRPTLINGLTIGFMFGLNSLLTSLMFGGGAIIYGMVNPCISVLPRILVGAAAVGAFRLINRIFRGKNQKTVFAAGVATGCVVGAAVNTVTVLTMIWLFKFVSGVEALYVMFTVNAIPELIVPAIITPLVTLGVRRGLRITDEFGNRSKTATSAKPENTDDFRFVQSGFAETDEHIEKPDETTATSARTDLTDTKEKK